MYLLILHCCTGSKLPLLLITSIRIQSGKQSARSDWRKLNRRSFVRKVLEELKSKKGSDNATQRLAITGNHYHSLLPRLEGPREEVTLLKCKMGKPGRNGKPAGSRSIDNGTDYPVCLSMGAVQEQLTPQRATMARMPHQAGWDKRKYPRFSLPLTL